MTCETKPEKPLSAQLREKRQDELYADMRVKIDIASLKRSLEKRRIIQQEIERILEKMAENSKKSEK